MAICSFADKRTKALFESGDGPAKWRPFKTIVARKLDMIDAATALADLRSPPGNRLEAL